MLHLFNFVAVALLKGTALAMIPGAIALAANALTESGTEGTASPSTTPKQTREIQQLSQRPEVTEAQAQAFEENDPLAPQPNSRKAAAPQTTAKEKPPTFKPKASPKKTAQQDKSTKQKGSGAPSLADLIRAEGSKKPMQSSS